MKRQWLTILFFVVIVLGASMMILSSDVQAVPPGGTSGAVSDSESVNTTGDFFNTCITVFDGLFNASAAGKLDLSGDNADSGNISAFKIGTITVGDPKNEKNSGLLTSQIRMEFIRSVFSETEDTDQAFDESAYLTFREASDLFSGAGKDCDSFEINILNLATDPLVADDSYLGREKGIKINLFCQESSEKIASTLWWFEGDATELVKSLYESECGERIGFVAVTFTKTDSDEFSVRFILNADDVQRLSTLWNQDGAVIRSSDWSDLKTGEKTHIVIYEEPTACIVPVSPKKVYIVENALYASDESFKDYITSSADTVTRIVYDTSEYARNADNSGLAASSEELVDKCLEVTETVSGYPVSDSNSEIKLDYISALTDLSKAGSAFWYAGLYTDQKSLEDACSFMESGFDKLNMVLNTTGSNPVETARMEVNPDMILSKYHNLNTAFHYEDSRKINSLGINVEGVRLRKALSLKEGNSVTRLEPDFGNIFVAITVDVTHLWHRGGGSDRIKTPAGSAYTLWYHGFEYKESTPSQYMTNVGDPYKKVTLQRENHYESNIIFEVPEGERFVHEDAYLRIDLGTYGTQVWKLG